MKEQMGVWRRGPGHGKSISKARGGDNNRRTWRNELRYACKCTFDKRVVPVVINQRP